MSFRFPNKYIHLIGLLQVMLQVIIAHSLDRISNTYSLIQTLHYFNLNRIPWELSCNQDALSCGELFHQLVELTCPGLKTLLLYKHHHLQHHSHTCRKFYHYTNTIANYHRLNETLYNIHYCYKYMNLHSIEFSKYHKQPGLLILQLISLYSLYLPNNL